MIRQAIKMSIEKLRERRKTLDFDIQNQQKRINELKTQIDGAEQTIRQWTDTLLIQRGQLLEIDNLIRESDESPPVEVDEKASKKRGKKDEEGPD